MMRMTSSANVTTGAPRDQRGSALGVTVHVVLLLLVLGQLVYLASRYRVRLDITSDNLWSLTDSTRSLLGNLEQRLLVEAYFSDKDKLPVNVRNTRAVLDNFLDEMVQLGKGKVVVERYDPNADKAIADKCSRVGIQPADMRSSSSSSVSLDRHWQGLRLVYGGGKQKVISQVAPPSSYQAEALVTPAIKEVVTSGKRKLGYMEWPAPQVGQSPAGVGWNALRTLDAVAKRYEFQNFKDEDGALLPDDLQTLFLFRPKDLTDRQKYVFDQFLMRGGTLVVFADAAEYAIGPRRAFTKMAMAIDAPGSKVKFTDQLANYGVEWRTKVLADLRQEAFAPRDRLQAPFEYLAMPQQTAFGQTMGWVPYPYFFHAVAGDWSKAADELARDAKGLVDADKSARYRELFGTGMPSDEFLFQSFRQIGRGPGFYWPTWVGLRQKGGADDLPAGVTGRVLLRSSPLMLAEDPPQNLDPIGNGDARARQEQFSKFFASLNERVAAQSREQAPLMVDVRGKLPSFFAGVERPKRPSEIKEDEAKKQAEDAKEQAADKLSETKPGEETPAPIGPEPAKTDDEAAAAALPAEAAQLNEPSAPGRIVMIGDSDFVRDDFVKGDYRQAGGPWSSLGPLFFAQLLDWLAEDKDLIALQSRVPVDRTISLVAEQAPGGDVRAAEQALQQKTRLVRVVNWLLPPLLLALFGLVVFAVRRGHKRRFLASVS